jgi:hypothetical protein
MSTSGEATSTPRRARRIVIPSPERSSVPDRRDARVLPSFDAIAARAYALYVARGAADGHDVDDWLQAERELAADA